MSQKKCVTIYGYSDDLVEIENSQYKEDEIDCYDKAIRFYFVDGTIISICYAQGGVWKITHEAIGKAWYELTRCEDDDDDAYSDVFKIDSEIISYEVFTPKAKSIQDIQEQNQEKSEKLIPNHIRLIFFGFEDTLFIHYTNQRFRDDAPRSPIQPLSSSKSTFNSKSFNCFLMCTVIAISFTCFPIYSR